MTPVSGTGSTPGSPGWMAERFPVGFPTGWSKAGNPCLPGVPLIAMSLLDKYKETSRGGLAVNVIEC